MLAKYLQDTGKLDKSYHYSRIEVPGMRAREMSIIRCMMMGASNDQIASMIDKTIHLVKNTFTSMYEQSYCRNRIEFFLWCLYSSGSLDKQYYENLEHVRRRSKVKGSCS
jgi:DNA-binding CsgD family transcriptional regulator